MSSWAELVYGRPADVATPVPQVVSAPTGRPSIFEVSALCEYLGDLLESDPLLGDVWLRGEVGNLSRSGAGHFYFSLRDAESQLRVVLFRGSAQRSPHLPGAGQAMVAHGAVRFYPAQGSCQLIADALFP